MAVRKSPEVDAVGALERCCGIERKIPNFEREGDGGATGSAGPDHVDGARVVSRRRIGWHEHVDPDRAHLARPHVEVRAECVPCGADDFIDAGHKGIRQAGGYGNSGSGIHVHRGVDRGFPGDGYKVLPEEPHGGQDRRAPLLLREAARHGSHAAQRTDQRDLKRLELVPSGADRDRSIRLHLLRMVCFDLRHCRPNISAG